MQRLLHFYNLSHLSVLQYSRSGGKDYQHALPFLQNKERSAQNLFWGLPFDLGCDNNCRYVVHSYEQAGSERANPYPFGWKPHTQAILPGGPSSRPLLLDFN